MENITIVVSCTKGLEGVVAQECEDILLGAGLTLEALEQQVGAVRFQSPMQAVVWLNLGLNCAARVYWEIEEFQAEEVEDIYLFAKKFRWWMYFSVYKSFMVKSTVLRDATVKEGHMATLKLKDGIADAFRARFGKRPSVSKDKPAVLVSLKLKGNRASLMLDTSGELLNRRNYRQEALEAPLNESLASGLLHISGWKQLWRHIAKCSQGKDWEPLFKEREQAQSTEVPMNLPRRPFLRDPFCGSGTIAMEALRIATGKDHNATREFFRFLNLKPFFDYRDELEKARGFFVGKERSDKEIKGLVRAFCRQVKVQPPSHLVEASDFNQEAVKITAETLENNFSSSLFKVKQQLVPKDIHVRQPHGFLVTNPPYGERLEDEDQLVNLYENFGRLLKDQFKGFDVWVLCSSTNLLKRIPLRPTTKHRVNNGSLECGFFNYLIHEE